MLMMMMLIIEVIYDLPHSQQKLCIRPGFFFHSPIIGELKKVTLYIKQLLRVKIFGFSCCLIISFPFKKL